MNLAVCIAFTGDRDQQIANVGSWQQAISKIISVLAKEGHEQVDWIMIETKDHAVIEEKAVV